MAQSIISKDLKQPDEFVSFWTHFGQKLSTHRRGVIAAGVAVVLGTGGGWGYLTWQESRAMDDSEGFALIEKNALAPVVADKADDAKAAKPAKAETDGILHFKTDEERLQATIKEVDNFLSTHGTSALGKRAQLIKANALLALGKYADAATAYQQLLDGETDKSMRLIERDGLALSQEGQGQIDKAIETYGTMAEEGRQAGNFYVDRALYGKARLLQKQGKGKDAEKILREILDKSPKTSLRREIDDRLATLADQ